MRLVRWYPRRDSKPQPLIRSKILTVQARPRLSDSPACGLSVGESVQHYPDPSRVVVSKSVSKIYLRARVRTLGYGSFVGALERRLPDGR
jgi:hypothetical protein